MVFTGSHVGNSSTQEEKCAAALFQGSRDNYRHCCHSKVIHAAANAQICFSGIPNWVLLHAVMFFLLFFFYPFTEYSVSKQIWNQYLLHFDYTLAQILVRQLPYVMGLFLGLYSGVILNQCHLTHILKHS